MGSGERTITPEAVSLSLDVAGLGSRLIALVIDVLIQLAILIPALLVLRAGSLGETATVVVLSVILLVVVWGYFAILELAWRGRTPGKRAQRIRVVTTEGQPPGVAAILVRNLIRIVDVFALPFLAVISMLLTARSQRLGDLAAGTMVVRESRVSLPTALPVADRDDLPALDAAAISEREYDVIRSFLLRRASLSTETRRQLAASLAASARRRAGMVPPGLDDETVLEAAAQAYRRRFSQGADPAAR
jgi:uncharacterized RDD family membrane protein YckC